MNELLKKQLEQRTAAQSAYEAIVTPAIEAGRALTDEERTSKDAHLADMDRLDESISELRDRIKRDADLAEARAAIGAEPTAPTAPAAPAAPSTETRSAPPAVVRSEPRIYDRESPHSYFSDVIRATNPAFGGGQESADRLHRYSKELNVEVRDGSSEGKRARRVIRTAHQENESRARAFEKDFEARAMDTTGASGGAFVTPQYLVEDYAMYRTFQRSFIDQTNKNPLPDYGMTVYLPVLQGPAGVAVQASQGSPVTESDPTAGYLSSNLTTEAGQVVISQQLLDRAGPGIQFDRIVFAQLQMAYNTAIDSAVVAMAIANGNPVAGAGAWTLGNFYGDVGNAMSQMETTPGTLLSPTHLYVSPPTWNFASTQTDNNGRPLIVPARNAPYNVISTTSGDGKSMPEGDTGYEILGQAVFKDGNIPTVAGTPTQTQLISAFMPEVWVWEGDLVSRTIPQTYAQNLQVLLQVYAYWTGIVRYPKAVQVIRGAAYQALPNFA